MRIADIISKKRDGYELEYEEMKFFINGCCDGTIPDYQSAAILMAIYIRGMNERETADLTKIMVESGETVDLTPIKGIKVDKHSTGGVGDKTTLVAGPVTAACGVPVAKMAGRALGHTGGTIDKLESIPGFNTSLSKEIFIDNVKSIGIAISSHTGNLVPADQKLYALRDVTATVESIPLVASSIMSKKLALGTDCIILDVKTGNGALMKDVERSKCLAKTMVSIGKHAGKKTRALITNMDSPMGMAVGNSLEVIEAIETLKGKGPKDFENLAVEVSALMLESAQKGNLDTCRKMARNTLYDGSALEKFSEMVKLQSGDMRIIDNYNLFKKPDASLDVYAAEEGYIKSIDTKCVGTVSLLLGAGRQKKSDIIDNSAGIKFFKKTGMKVKKGEIVARLYSGNKSRLKEVETVFYKALKYDRKPVRIKPVVLDYIY